MINYSLRYQVPLEKIRGIDLAMDDVVNGGIIKTTLKELRQELGLD
ncbi:hypothetical protein PVA45_08555 (plasmid) [Entomospira entomophila]|uniref:Uncharacterized protein n=1 Tax=Entomospira entomophila TaxID=2719988 RepID=A0A968GDG6_9SPIO|nr:hypothetical protein [Entomospira entomophilus]NIZ41558.1 hypothetical protein [Entomospira entomophilus]WDI36462.1 hypothetical protein PVA45_08555 [Entomospira entomophilus]